MSSTRPELPRRDLEEILEAAEDVFEALRGARIFMTGGTGFFGRWLVESLLHADRRLGLSVRLSLLTRNRVALLGRWAQLGTDTRVTLFEGDVRSFELPPSEHSHIIHAATDTVVGPSPNESRRLFDVIVDGTQHVLEYGESCGATHVLFTSSGAVYGQQPPEMDHVQEDFTGVPDPMGDPWSYGAGKRAAEALCGLGNHKSGLEVSVARCFAFVGPHLPLDAHFAIGNFIRDSLQGGPIRVLGDGSPVRSYLYGADLARWLWTILVNGTAGRAYNVGTDRGFSIREVAKAVAAQTTPRPEVIISHRPKTGLVPARYVPSIDRARNELGLGISVDLEEAIRRTISWHRGL